MSQARRYSDAQVVRLGVLGLVPWIRREDRAGAYGEGGPAKTAPEPMQTDASVGPPVPAELADLPIQIPARPPATSVTPVALAVEPAGLAGLAGTPEPTDIASLGEWLAEQPLAGFARRGERRHETGPEQATILVVAQAEEARSVVEIESPAGPDAGSMLPLTATQSELLDLMLRAIGSVLGDWSTAALADPTRDDVQGGVGGTPNVARVLEGRRVLIWLTRSPGDEAAAEAHRFEVTGVPAFRMAHPALLLERPSGKRQAWTVLKALRNRLAGA